MPLQFFIFQLKQQPQDSSWLVKKEPFNYVQPRPEQYMSLLKRDIGSVSTDSYFMLLNMHATFIRDSSLKDQADIAGIILAYASKNKLSEVQRQFLYEIGAMVAPAHAAFAAESDYLMKADEFRKKNGAYNGASNNCRHYPFKLYYSVLNKFIDYQMLGKLGKMKFGRPKNFDWRGSNPKILRTSDAIWEGMPDWNQFTFFQGKPAFISYTFKASDIDKAEAFLKPGDLIGIDRNPRGGGPHVGIVSADGQIVHIGKPIYRDSLKDFSRRSRTITVYKLASRYSLPQGSEPIGAADIPATGD